MFSVKGGEGKRSVFHYTLVINVGKEMERDDWLWWKNILPSERAYITY